MSCPYFRVRITMYLRKVSSACYFFLSLVYAVNVHMPRDRITQLHQSYGFVEFMGEEDADYAIKIMNMIKLYGKPIRVNKVQSKEWVCDHSSYVHVHIVYMQHYCTSESL